MKYAIFTILVFPILHSQGQQVSFSWAKPLGGVSGGSAAHSIAVDNLGNVYTTGWFNGAADFDPGPGVFLLNANGIDAFVCKMDAGGNLIWVKQIEGIFDQAGFSITIDPAGNLLVTGYFDGTADFDPSTATSILNTFGGYDIFIAKMSSAGDLLWTRQMGGGNHEIGNSIKTDASGNIYSTGIFYGTSDFDPGPGIFNLTSIGNYDNYISKLDVNGNFAWAIRVGGDGEGGPALGIDNSGNVYATGAFAGTYDFDPGPSTYSLSSSAIDIFVAKYSPDGNLIWVNKIGGTSYDNGYNIAVSGSGNVYVCGDFSNSVDFDPTSSNVTLTTFGDYDIFICKFDANGNFAWARQLGGAGIEQGLAIALDNNENVYTTGNFRGIGDFDPGPCVYLLNPAGSTYDDIYISKLNADGNFIWAKKMGGIKTDYALSIAVNSSSEVFTGGVFADTVDFDPGFGIYNLYCDDLFDAFVHKLSPCSNSSNSYMNVTSCGAFTLNCKTFTNTGLYTLMLENAQGCDSIITLDLTIGPITSSEFISSCTSYSFNGQTLTNSGVYYDTLITGNGCDSIIQLNLTITPPSISTNFAGGCIAYTWNGQTLTTSGVYTDTLVSSSGCDSIAILNLTILPSATSLTIVNSCSAYLWNGKLYSISGTYRDTFVSNAACDSIAELQLLVTPAIESVVTQSICAGQSFENYVTTGVYKDSFLTVNGCDSIRTLNLSVINPPSPDLGPDKGLCFGDSIKIYAGQFTSYQWQDGSSRDHIIARNPGSYSVVVSNSCGTGTDEIIIGEGICDLYFPSAFTPNQDGKNDVFKALGNPALAEYSLIVFNRWGEKIFSTNELSKGWNGALKGRAQPTGAYAWYCVYRKTSGGEKMIVKGTIMLIR